MKIIKIGRSSSNDININDALVSRAHCQIIQDDNGNYRLIDVGSTNGTYVNGIKRHGEIQLNPSDIIRIGNSTLPWQSYFQSGGHTSNPTPSPNEPTPEKPSNFLAWSILSTIFCCIPFGIISIVNSAKVDNLWNEGKYREAEEAASKARTWFWWSFGTGLVIQIASAITSLCLELI